MCTFSTVTDNIRRRFTVVATKRISFTRHYVKLSAVNVQKNVW